MTESGLVDPVAVGPGDTVDDLDAAIDAALVTPAPNGAADGAVDAAVDGAAADPALAAGAALPPGDPADASLLALVDRLTAILERSELAELEVAAGETTIILRSPAAIERQVAPAAGPAAEAGPPVAEAAPAAAPDAPPPAAAPAKPSVNAPLTGIFYAAPSPGATPYVSVGDHVSIGQIIGLIEAMKLFNEIKCDRAGRVARICAESGALVKAKQPLIEVESA